MTRRLLARLLVFTLIVTQAAGFTSALAQGLGGVYAPADQNGGAQSNVTVQYPQGPTQPPTITNVPERVVPASAPQVTVNPGTATSPPQAQSAPSTPTFSVPNQLCSPGQPYGPPSATVTERTTAAGTTKQPTPLPGANEFEQFICNATGEALPMFGYDLFRGAPSTFAPW